MRTRLSYHLFSFFRVTLVLFGFLLGVLGSIWRQTLYFIRKIRQLLGITSCATALNVAKVQKNKNSWRLPVKTLALMFFIFTFLSGTVFAQYPSSATGSYTVTTSGNKVIYTFTGNGTFTPSAGLTADILVIAGGGGGGGTYAASGRY